MRSTASSVKLVLVPAVTPAPRPIHSALDYAVATTTSPLVVALATLASCAGLLAVGFMTAIMCATIISGIAVLASGGGRVRRVVDRHFEQRAASQHEAWRQRQLRGAGAARRQQYAALRELASEVERTDPAEACRAELDGLLDQFVTLCARHQRFMESLRRAGCCDLPIGEQPGGTVARSRRREVLERRIRHRDECMIKIAELADTIDAIDELVHLVAQRASCRALDPEVTRELDRRLWELDTVDAAIEQLSA